MLLHRTSESHIIETHRICCTASSSGSAPLSRVCTAQRSVHCTLRTVNVNLHQTSESHRNHIHYRNMQHRLPITARSTHHVPSRVCCSEGEEHAPQPHSSPGINWGRWHHCLSDCHAQAHAPWDIPHHLVARSSTVTNTHAVIVLHCNSAPTTTVRLSSCLRRCRMQPGRLPEGKGRGQGMVPCPVVRVPPCRLLTFSCPKTRPPPRQDDSTRGASCLTATACCSNASASAGSSACCCCCCCCCICYSWSGCRSCCCC